MTGLLPRGVLGRSLALAAGVAVVLIVSTQVPLVPMPGDATQPARLVPLDTWAATQFPGARDFYRAYLATLLQPTRLPLVAVALGLVCAIALSFPNRFGIWLASLMPPLSARGLGLFRLAFGLALTMAVRSEAPASVPLDLQRATSWLPRQDVVRLLAASPDAGYWVWQAASALLLCFALGLWPRLALVGAAVAMTLFIGIGLTAKAMHDWGVPLVTLWMLTLVPWHDSLGVQTAIDRWRARSRPPASPAWRGLALWLPGLTLGLAFAAAAFAKLDTSGLAWMTGGAIRFHFIEDARQAPVDWGLAIARSDLAAVILSFGALLVEGGFWLVTLTARTAARALFGLAGVSMLIGFYLFQGVFWPAWWALFLAFVPWSAIDARLGARWTAAAPDVSTRAEAVPRGAAPALPAFASAIIALLVVQQPIVSALRIESEPFLSDYSMYSYTWPSKEAFDAHLLAKTTRYELTADDLDAEDFDHRLRQIPRAVDVVSDAIGYTRREEAWPATTWTAMAAVRRDYHTRFGTSLSQVVVRVQQRGFDWARGAFDEQPRTTAERILDLDTGRFHDDP